MIQVAPTFGAYQDYERFMGRWSRAVGSLFLEWLSPPADARWLEVGCGTGIFTQLIVELCRPRTVHAVDTAHATIRHLSAQPLARSALLHVADGTALPFENGKFDIVVSALVLNFISDLPLGLAEMSRVAVPGGNVAGYVWDFENELSPSGPLRRAMRDMGFDVSALPGAGDSTTARLSALFRDAGLENVRWAGIDVSQVYGDFDDFWRAQTTRYSPTTPIINALSDSERSDLKAALLRQLSSAEDGIIAYSARANAMSGHIPR